jgi:putative PIG3 family NAD(P)H quinone oxidoreductase
MLAVVIVRPGGPDVLEIRELPDPTPGPSQVRVRVRATALNRADLLQRRGLYPAPPGCPRDIPGLEYAGEVESCGAAVESLRPGDRVMGLLGGGGYASMVVTDERSCLPVPPRLSWAEAAAVPEAYLTAHDALFARGGLKAGESVLVHAAASGVGIAAAQIAAAVGARVLGTSRTPDKRDRLREMGGMDVLDPSDPSLEERIRLSAGGDGVDVIVDFLGAASWDLNLAVLATGGRLVLVGTLGGSRVRADLGRLMTRRLTVTGTVLRSRPQEEKILLARDFGRRMLPLLSAGRLRPVIDRVLPLSRAAEAHAAMEGNENFGKIVLEIP